MNRRRGYKFTNKRHTRLGLISSGIGLFVLLLLSGLFYLSFRQAGNIGGFAGFLGFLSLLAAAAGLWMGVRSFREEERYYLFSFVGCLLNGGLLIALILLYVLGM